MLYQLSYFRSLRLLRRATLMPLAAVAGAEGQNRTDDTSIFSAVLYLLSYLGDKNIIITARRSVKFNAQLTIDDKDIVFYHTNQHPSLGSTLYSQQNRTS